MAEHKRGLSIQEYIRYLKTYYPNIIRVIETRNREDTTHGIDLSKYETDGSGFYWSASIEGHHFWSSIFQTREISILNEAEQRFASMVTSTGEVEVYLEDRVASDIRFNTTVYEIKLGTTILHCVPVAICDSGVNILVKNLDPESPHRHSGNGVHCTYKGKTYETNGKKEYYFLQPKDFFTGKDLCMFPEEYSRRYTTPSKSLSDHSAIKAGLVVGEFYVEKKDGGLLVEILAFAEDSNAILTRVWGSEYTHDGGYSLGATKWINQKGEYKSFSQSHKYYWYHTPHTIETQLRKISFAEAAERMRTAPSDTQRGHPFTAGYIEEEPAVGKAEEKPTTETTKLIFIQTTPL